MMFVVFSLFVVQIHESLSSNGHFQIGIYFIFIFYLLLFFFGGVARFQMNRLAMRMLTQGVERRLFMCVYLEPLIDRKLRVSDDCK